MIYNLGHGTISRSSFLTTLDFLSVKICTERKSNVVSLDPLHMNEPVLECHGA
jgi:hypothetical protein